MTDPRSLLPVAFQAADIAADMMRTRRPAQLTEKHDRDLVSDVDLAIERQVRAHLAGATPDIGFLGEEEGQSGSPAGGKQHLNPVRRHRTYPRVIKRARHNSYRVKRPSDQGIRHSRPPTIKLANLGILSLAA
jgi:3'-phosphoadenosine 5'-phosphosulfate (PAPS) 3'-phosphatase